VPRCRHNRGKGYSAVGIFTFELTFGTDVSMKFVERRAEKAHRDMTLNADVAKGMVRLLHTDNAAGRALRVRVICRRCRRRLETIEDVDNAYTTLDSDSRLVLSRRRSWRCSRCRGGDYPVTLERMRVEHAAAVVRGDHAIELPLV
jgi:hypothetical protein